MKKVLGALTTVIAMATAVPALAANAEVTTDLHMRAGPGTQYPVVTTIPGGGDVQVFGCVDGYNWCDAAWGGQRGWVYSTYLAYFYHQRRRPIAEVGRRAEVPIISFSFGDYAERHYRGRSWYRDRARWEHHGNRRDHDRDHRGHRDHDHDRHADRAHDRRGDHHDRDRDNGRRDHGDRRHDGHRDRDHDRRADRDHDRRGGRDRDRDYDRNGHRDRDHDRDARRGDHDGRDREVRKAQPGSFQPDMDARRGTVVRKARPVQGDRLIGHVK